MSERRLLVVDDEPDFAEFVSSTATDLGARGRDDLYGNGLVQADAAVAAALNTSP